MYIEKTISNYLRKDSKVTSLALLSRTTQPAQD